jgi:Predicted soluble lytic transglycosylase fused to an ABC-type amino acid-binding protein
MPQQRNARFTKGRIDCFARCFQRLKASIGATGCRETDKVLGCILSGERMTRPTLLIALCLLLLPLPALARLAGPLQVGQPSQVRDLAQIRSSQVLRVLVNQSRNSSGEVQGQAIGVEYHRLRAFEHYLNSHARDGQEITLKIIPKAKDQLLGALSRGEGDVVAPGELIDFKPSRAISASDPIVDEVPLLLVGVKGERRFTRMEQLSGRTVALTTGSAAGHRSI